jgi:predicted RNA-binding Zn-ribbon protein involved in translation (DUF1610 family)
MIIVRRTGQAWPVQRCTACSRTVHPTDEAMLLRMPNQIPIVLCNECGQAIATESDPTRLLQYLDLFPSPTSANPHPQEIHP